MATLPFPCSFPILRFPLVLLLLLLPVVFILFFDSFPSSLFSLLSVSPPPPYAAPPHHLTGSLPPPPPPPPVPHYSPPPPAPPPYSERSPPPPRPTKRYGLPLDQDKLKECNIFEGSWEDESRPFYEPGSCPYVDMAFACVENGRTDKAYLNWRWKPRDCLLPRFNGTDLLERLRGKNLMFVGDSVNRNQFESMLCLLHESLPDKRKMYETRGYKITKGRGYFIFLFEFVRSHFLVHEGTRVNGQGNSRPTLTIDRIDKSAKRWKKADILIFNTGHWWTHGKTARGNNYYQEGDIVYPKFDAVEAFKRAMRTWGSWIDNNMHPRKSLVFYRGYSTAHFRGGDWDSGGSCKGEIGPIVRGPMLDNYPLKMKIVEDVIRKMTFPVILLNVTKMTNFRKDGHPSIYGKNQSLGLKVSSRKQDCSHWCLPGVPDAWNEMIYATLVLGQSYR